MDSADQTIKSDHHPLLIPNIPFFHHSIIPRVPWRQTPPLSPSCKLYEPEAGVKSKAGLLVQDSLPVVESRPHTFLYRVLQNRNEKAESYIDSAL
jgi:hypothetical protein